MGTRAKGGCPVAEAGRSRTQRRRRSAERSVNVAPGMRRLSRVSKVGRSLPQSRTLSPADRHSVNTGFSRNPPHRRTRPLPQGFSNRPVMPRACWEPWGLFRKPCEGRVQDNLRKWRTGGLRRLSKEPFKDLIESSVARNGERAIAPRSQSLPFPGSVSSRRVVCQERPS